ncbi:LANO_0D04038g1_1 [Lachancea nothofagi CBS 11611]|uniref:Leucine carboxyl methyltransferase 1 n=1 Tax=Lachancea nothofagi CBS 11611 TaxID=1266666 RepID=A0A1G4JGC1_9SACH|nr:LANO_0D04038g1_1 [Lachancea nothofagi CBS 11611]
MDRAVQQTDYDAFSCKISAIAKKYLPCQKQVEYCGMEDYAALHMAYGQGLKALSRRAYGKIQKAVNSGLPLMNYGTYLRTLAVDVEIMSFLKQVPKNSKVQIVNLGCGSDLRMIHFMSQYPQLTWVDLDYSESVSVKAKILKSNDCFLKTLGPPQNTDDAEYVSDRYLLRSCNLNIVENLLDILKEFTYPDVQTLVLTECVLCYVKLPQSQRLIHEMMSFYQTGTWVSYDPIGGEKKADKFGSIMQANLREARQLELPTLMVFNSPAKYSQRFEDNSKSTEIRTMWQYYVQEITDVEKNRLKSLQFLDEIEEVEIVLSHYVLLKAIW